MPVTFTVANHRANKVVAKSHASANSAADVLDQTWGSKRSRVIYCGELLQSSVQDSDLASVRPERNGFVETVVAAYSGHHHLILRADDVWIAVLGQFNVYVNAHAEELRAHFVQHDGKKALSVDALGTRYAVDFGHLAQEMTSQIHANIVDPKLKDWILPDFSTTTHNDTIVSAVLMIATLKAYFTREFILQCGIPSVTLEGTKSDWEKLLAKLDKLPTFGPEPAVWAKMLRPIFTRFVRAFDGKPDVDFWNRVCRREIMGSGPGLLSGWITAFCVWSSKGEWQGPPLSLFESQTSPFHAYESNSSLSLDGAFYRTIDRDCVPVGFCEVDVKLNDNGELFDCLMVSGHIGQTIQGKGDALRPYTGWFMFITTTKRPRRSKPMAVLHKRPNAQKEIWRKCWNIFLYFLGSLAAWTLLSFLVSR